MDYKPPDRRAQLAEEARNIHRHCDAIAETLEFQAHELVDGFRQTRQALQADAEDAANAARPRAAKPVRYFAPLSIFARYHQGTLQLFWQEVHRNRKTKKPVYKYLRFSSKGGYNLQSLLASAQAFEKELVRETELQAAELRANWKKLVALRKLATSLLPAKSPVSKTNADRDVG